MAEIVVTLKVMPNGVETDLNEVQKAVEALISTFVGKYEGKASVEPIGFGLSSLKIIFLMNEDKGSTEALEEQIKQVPGVESVEVVDVRRTMG